MSVVKLGFPNVYSTHIAIHRPRVEAQALAPDFSSLASVGIQEYLASAAS